MIVLVALKKRIPSKICFLSCLVRLKSFLFNLLCVFEFFSECRQSTLFQIPPSLSLSLSLSLFLSLSLPLSLDCSKRIDKCPQWLQIVYKDRHWSWLLMSKYTNKFKEGKKNCNAEGLGPPPPEVSGRTRGDSADDGAGGNHASNCREDPTADWIWSIFCQTSRLCTKRLAKYEFVRDQTLLHREDWAQRASWLHTVGLVGCCSATSSKTSQGPPWQPS